MPARHIPQLNRFRGTQNGAVLFVMLVILVIGAAALLVSALNSSSVKNARDKVTADALAQARMALIAYAVSDLNRPGELPCPDFNNDGMITLSPDYSGSNCKSLVGWLPWQTLGLPDLRDGNGDRLWYALANPFHANGTAILNSDTPANYSLPILNPAQMLTVIDSATGVTLDSGVIAIVFSPGTVLQGQTRSYSDSNATTALPNYLEADNANLNTTFQTGNNNQVPIPTPTVNDRLLTLDSRDLFPPVEKRIAREAKACLDSYAAVSANKYPWAAPVADSSSSPGINGNYNGTYGKYFGRIPAQPSIDTTSNPASTLMTALNTLQAAENAYNSSNSSANQTALYNAANTVVGLKYSVSNVSSSTIDHAADTGTYYANNPSGSAYTNATSALTTATGALTSSGDLDTSMSVSWPPTCTLLNNPGSYFWTAWKNMVFFQVASGYQPTSSASFGTPLTINGSGAYRATVLIARTAISSAQLAARSSPGTNPPTPYLEGINPHYGSTATTVFNTYSLADPNYATVNDLVLCLDGKGTNPASVCP